MVGENPSPWTRTWPVYRGLKYACAGCPRLMTPNNVLVEGSVTETVFEYCSAA